MNCGLVLEGGARRGIYTAGVLDYFMDEGLTFPYVIGASAGAQAALDFLSGQRGRSRDVMIIPQDKFPFSTTIRSKLAAYMRRITYVYPYKQFPYDFNAYFNNKTKFEIVLTDAETARPVYVTEKQNEKRLLDILAASCSLPILFPMGSVDGKPYLDGSIADALPFERAFAQGCDKVIVVMTKAPVELCTDYSKLKILISRVYEEQYPVLYASLLDRVERYKQERELMWEYMRLGKILVMQPGEVLVKGFETNTDKLVYGYEYGYQAAKSRISEIRAFIGE